MFEPNDQYLSYYKFNDAISYSKYDMIHNHKALPDQTQYYFYDDSFSKLDWKEPKESIDDLYKLRAEQLRDKYSKIALEVRNIDGINTLVSFLKNGIRVDEVFFYYTRGDLNSQHNNEIRMNIVPKIQELQNHFNFYFRPIECDRYYIEKMWNDYIKNNLMYIENGPWTGDTVIHKDLLDLVPEYRVENLGVIYSNGKPFVFPEKNVFRFCDILPNIYFIKDLCEYNNEDFYWSPDTKIVIKQAYLVNQWANKHKNYLQMIPKLEYNNHGYVPLKLINRAIYPSIKENTFKYYSSPIHVKYDIKAFCMTTHTSSPQAWLYRENYSIKDTLINTISIVEKNIDSSWLENNTIYEGLKPVWSRDYNLE